MKKYGLIGFPLGHSFSKRYFTDKFEREGLSDCKFELFEIPKIEDLPAVLESNPDLVGLCVTIPYKQQVMQYLDKLDPACEGIGAVNCIQFQDGRFIGHNTDYIGFKNSLRQWLGQERPKALVLGTGGASKAVEAALSDLDIHYQMVSRNPSAGQISYSDLRKDSSYLNDYKLLINTTPLGTFPKTDGFPDLPLDQLNSSHLYYDLVYNPAETGMMKEVITRGGKAMNGMEMLIGQAEAAWKIWNQD